MFGYQVDCVCYSKYLSDRDYESFLNLFQIFKVVDLISYSTIKELCEKIINSQGNIREYTLNFLNSTLQNQNLKKNSKKKVLLIDEVDVFFSKDFFGNTYNPIALYQNKNVSKLIEFIWKNDVNIHQIKKSSEYSRVATSLSKFGYILDNEVTKMLIDKKDINNPPYEVFEGKIGYKEFDGISTKTSWGYKTQFAYIKECGRGVSEEEKDNALGLTINCGKFSYATIPHSFDLIMGFTGTLKSLTATQEKIITNYKIKKKTFAPSMFGKSNFSFEPIGDFYVEKEKEQRYLKLFSDTSERLKNGRAVLIFFETENDLKDFKHSGHCKFPELNLNEITPLTKKIDKLSKIRKASRSGTVTLLTRHFGRGKISFSFFHLNILIK